MREPASKLQTFIWAVVLLNLAFIAVLYLRSTREAAGPVRELPVIAAVGEFTLTNQLGRTISRADLLGNVWVADIIFTRCPGPCPKMTGQMAQLQTGLAADLPVKFVTLTADPAHDTAPVLKQYGETHRADPARWHFLTGDKRGVYDLAISGLKLGVEERASGQPLPLEDQFVHTTVFVLVDKQGRLRGSFESAEPEFQKQILLAVKRLLREK